MLPSQFLTRFSRLVPLVAWMIAILLVALVGRALTDRWVTESVPLSLDQRSTDPRATAREIAARLSSGVPPATPVVVSETHAKSIDYTLMGVATGFSGAPGFALLRTTSGDIVAAVQGEQLPSGETVLAIGHDHLRLSLRGHETTLLISQEAMPGTVPAARTPRRP